MEFRRDKIIIDRELSEIDKFVLEFVSLIKDMKYSLVSGYVAILFGRPRGTEDIDIIIDKRDAEKFMEIMDILERNNWWCINTSDWNEMYELLVEGMPIRLSKKPWLVPNIELKIAKSWLDNETLENPVTVQIGGTELKIPPIELQIAYKEILLGSKKDLEDAAYLEEVLKDFIDKEKLESWRSRIRSWAGRNS